MKTLTTNQIAEINKLYSKYNASQEKTTWSNGGYDCTNQQRSATQRAYNKLNSYIESVTDIPSHVIVFKLVNGVSLA